MKILVTGSKGFIGKNLTAQLKNNGYTDLLLFDKDLNENKLEDFLKECDFIFHLAGVNRPKNQAEFESGNVDFARSITEKLESYGNNCPIVACSSIQAENDNPYGNSKKAMEDLLFSYAKSTQAPVYIYRLTNIFGKWCRPAYNSVVATFCHNIARELKIRIDNPETVLQLTYIDDVINDFIKNIAEPPNTDSKGFCNITPVHSVKLGELADKLYSFHKNRNTLVMPSFTDDFDRKLYAAYISYLPEEAFSYSLDKKTDERGYFCECIKSNEFGQISVSVTKPGFIRGNHWHHTKAEKFMVVKGKALVSFRKIGNGDIFQYLLTDSRPELIDIPVGYTHSIENIGSDDLIILIWCNELFDPEKPDTYYEPVIK